MTSKPKRNYLTLQKKVDVIKVAEENRRLGLRELGERFQCGKTQIAHILKNKESILSLYESNMSCSRVYASKTCDRKSEYSAVNKSLYDWYVLACSKNIYPMGPQLIEKAKQIASFLGKQKFVGSNGWLEKWKKRYNVKELRICGESGDVKGPTVDSWLERVPELVAGYAQNNIWNMDETGLFWKALPDRGFGVKGKQCTGGKKSKQRFTVAFFVTASGEREKPIIIWKAANPRCLKRFDKAVLPVDYYSQKKAWMDSDILETILVKLNRRLSSNGRSILLFIDNAGCHPSDLRGKFSNINICFLPANTTSKLQPLDLGIIHNFKVHYRNLFLKYVLAKIDQSNYSAKEINKSVNVLVAIRWVAVAWSKVKEETIRKCFCKAGILGADMSVVERYEQDPFSEADEYTALQSLMTKTMNPQETCPLQEYLNGEDDLAVCRDTDETCWEESFFANLHQDQDDKEASGDEEEDEQENPALHDALPLLVNSYKQAIEYLEEVQRFLESKGHIEDTFTIGSVVDNITSLQVAASKQTTLDSWLRN